MQTHTHFPPSFPYNRDLYCSIHHLCHSVLSVQQNLSRYGVLLLWQRNRDSCQKINMCVQCALSCAHVNATYSVHNVWLMNSDFMAILFQTYSTRKIICNFRDFESVLLTFWVYQKMWLSKLLLSWFVSNFFSHSKIELGLKATECYGSYSVCALTAVEFSGPKVLRNIALDLIWLRLWFAFVAFLAYIADTFVCILCV